MSFGSDIANGVAKQMTIGAVLVFIAGGVTFCAARQLIDIASQYDVKVEKAQKE